MTPWQAGARNAELLSAYDEGVRCADLARKYGISRQRVHQIVLRSGKPLPAEVTHECLNCGRTIMGQGKLYCNQSCWQQRHHPHLTGRCPICGIPITRYATYCSAHKGYHTKTEREAKQNEAATLYLSGMTYEQIADRMGCSRPMVYKYLKGANVVPQRKPHKVFAVSSWD